MGTGGVKSRGRVASTRRIAAMVVTMACHLVLLMALLRPAAPGTDRPSAVESDEAALIVRFITQPRAMSVPTPSHAPRAVAALPAVPRKTPEVEKALPPVQHVTRDVAAPPPAGTAIHALPSSGAPFTPDQYVSDQTPMGDGGFQDRMRNAQHSQSIRGVPGSDRRVVQGIELIDPRDQGIGAVVRGAQRLFGVTSRQCIDVEVWQQLSPEELIARHLTMDDVKNQSEKYNCNRPKGLNF